MLDLTLYLPIAGMEINVIKLILLGFTVGVIGGFFGVGGAFIVTPALNVFGFPMAYAIGTDMAHIAGKSIISTVRHRSLGNVDMRLGLLMIAGTVPGIEISSSLVMLLERAGKIGPVVRMIYTALLFGLGFFMIIEYLKSAKEHRGGQKEGSGAGSLAQKIQSVHIPPMIRLRVSGFSVSLWVILGIAVITGFIAGLLGVGGGFIRMPALMYLIGTTTKVAVGTDLFEVMFSGMYGAFTYALKGRVEIVAALIMLTGAAAGSQLGALATRYVDGLVIRLYFAVTMILAGMSVVFKHIAEQGRDVYWKALSDWAGNASGLAGKADLSRWLHTNKGVVETWFAVQPEALQAARAAEKLWNNCSCYLMLGASCALSAVIVFFLIRGILGEKTAEAA